MPNDLGKIVQKRRKELNMSLRELARRIGKSPTFVTLLENDDSPPSASVDTLKSIERELGLETESLVTLAGKVSPDLKPESSLEVALYRQVKSMPEDAQERLLQQLRRKGRK